MHDKRCVLLIVDALSYDVVQSMIGLGELPSVARLIDRGGQLSPCVSIFPSITPAATCSIITGCYPKDHGIEGACWLDRDQGEIAYYGDDVQLAVERGFYDYIVDFGDRLNFERLQAATLFEQLHQQGVDSLAVNSMWFAGPHQHDRSTPLALKLGVGALPGKVGGPKYMKLGSFVEALPDGVPPQPSPSIFNRYGFQDQITIDCLLDVARAGKLPPMTVGYFPENDDLGHSDGIRRAADTALVRFDSFLAEFVDHLGGWEHIGRETEVLIVGDHSQVEFGDSGPNVVRLDELLDGFSQADLSGGWDDGDELFVCPNMRAAAIYLRRPDDESLRRRVVERLLQCGGVDLIALEQSDKSIQVQSADRGELVFRASDDTSGLADTYGNCWTVDGDIAAVGLIESDSGEIVEGDYPNPLERLHGAFVSGTSPIWISARTDTEFSREGQSIHQGGSHAGLHHVDSIAALITSAGIDVSSLPNPSRPRIVDVNPLCRQVFNHGDPSNKVTF